MALRGGDVAQPVEVTKDVPRGEQLVEGRLCFRPCFKEELLLAGVGIVQRRTPDDLFLPAFASLVGRALLSPERKLLTLSPRDVLELPPARRNLASQLQDLVSDRSRVLWVGVHGVQPRGGWHFLRNF